MVAAMLHGHRLTFESNEPAGSPDAFFANVRVDGSSLVPGAVYELDAPTLEALDAYEDVARGVYERADVRVSCTGGRDVVAVAYRMPKDGKPLREGLPSSEQLRQIREGYADWGLDLRVLSRATRSIPSTRS